MFATMLVALPLIVYTVVTYNLTIALRAMTVVGCTIQVSELCSDGCTALHLL